MLKFVRNGGSDITVDAKARESGIRMETRPTAKIYQGTKNPPLHLLIGIIAVVIIGLVFIISKLTRTDQITAVVSAIAWQRSQVIEAYQPVEHSDWESSLPANATPENCNLQYRYDSDTPQQTATEECGEPYTIDTGTGIGQVVQDVSTMSMKTIVPTQLWIGSRWIQSLHLEKILAHIGRLSSFPAISVQGINQNGMKSPFQRLTNPLPIRPLMRTCICLPSQAARGYFL